MNGRSAAAHRGAPERDPALLLLDAAGQGLATIDAQGRFDYVNPAFATLVGRAPDELIGRRPEELTPPEDHALFAELRSRQRAAEAIRHDLRLRQKDGSRMDVEVTVAPRWRGEQVVGATVMVTDLTEQKRAEQALRDSEEFLRRTLESSPDCIKVLDLDARLVSINETGRCLLEIDNPDDCRDADWLEVWKGADHEAATQAVAAARAGKTATFSGFCPTMEGTPKWWEVQIAPILGADHRPERLLVISRDVTARRQAEDALRERSQRFEQLVEQASDIIYRTDVRGYFTYANPVAVRITGFSEAELVRMHYLDLVRPDVRDEMRAFYLHQLHTATASTYREFPLVTATGEEIWIGQNLNLVSEANRVTGVQAVARDITKRYRAEQALHAANGEMEHRIAARTAELSETNEALQAEVAERQQAEAALRRSEQDYRGLFENAHDAILILNPADETVLEANPRASELYGLPRAELVGRSMISLSKHPNADSNRADATLTAAAPFCFETTQYRGDGSEVQLEITATTVAYQGRSAILSINRDITERKRADEQLRGRLRIEGALARVSARLASSSSAALEGVLREFGEAMEVDRAYVVLFRDGDPPKDAVHEWCAPGSEPRTHQLRLHRSAVSNAWMQSLAAGETLVVSDVDRLPDAAASERQSLRERGIRALLAVPVVADDQAIRGFLGFDAATPRAWSGEDTRVLGVLSGMIATHLARREATDALARSEDYFRSLIENGSDIVAVVDETATIHYESPSVAKVLGYSQAEVVGKSFFEFAHPDDQTEVGGIFAGLIAESGSLISVPVRVRRKDGAWRFMEAVATNLLHLPAVRGVIINARDVTDRHQAEQTLRESEQRFRQLVEQAADAVVLHEAGGRIMDVNQRACDSLGYTRDELLSMNIAEIEEASTSDLLGPHGPHDELPAARTLEGVHRRKDGSTFPVEVRVGVVEMDGVRRVLSLARDISERRSLEEQLLQAQKMEAVGKLAGGIAHDFNNLLTAIKGFAALLRAELAENEPLQGYVAEIERAGTRAADLTRQLLAFSRKQVLQPIVLDLNCSVAGVEPMLRRLIGEDVELQAVLTPALGSVRADPGQIEQVIVNLAVNARDAMPTGGRLTLATRNADLDDAYVRTHVGMRPGEYVVLSVSDTGMGMDRATRERIWEPFFTTKEQGKGTGLGLSTVYGIIRQSGGAVYVYSEVGRGTTFKIYLPRVDTPAIAPTPGASPTAAPRGSETVLLVEDEAAVRTLARMVLRKSGYTVLEAADGEQALRALDEHGEGVDLLVTDVVMPGMSGPVLAERLVARSPRTRVMFMSGYTDDAILHHGVPEAGIAFLEKPFLPHTLVRRVREVLDAPAVRA